MSCSRTSAHPRETRLRIRIIPSIRFDLVISNQHLITLKQTAIKYPGINIQPDFVGVIVSNVERLSRKERKGRKEITAMLCVFCGCIKSLPQRLRTRMTRIGRIFTDTKSVYIRIIFDLYKAGLRTKRFIVLPDKKLDKFHTENIKVIVTICSVYDRSFDN